MKEIKPVVTEKRHLDIQKQPFLITTFCKVWTVKNMKQGSKSTNFELDLFLEERKFSIETWLEDIRSEVVEK